MLARAQQPPMPVIGFVDIQSARDAPAGNVAAFRKGLVKPATSRAEM